MRVGEVWNYTFDVDVKAAITGFNAGLLAYALEVAVDVGFAAGDGAAGDAGISADAKAAAFLGFLVGGFVLQAFYAQVAAYVGFDASCGYDGPLEGGVACAFELDCAALDAGVGIGDVVAVALAFAFVGAGVDGQAAGAVA